MLHLIPAPLHRVLYRVAHALRRQWWRVGRPRRSSVIVIAFDEAGRVLLVRHSYGRPAWSLPGGGLNRGEDPERAAIREFAEELGCGLADLTPVDTIEQSISGSRDTQYIFAARVVGHPVPDMREIVAAAFADPANLPAECGPRTRERIGQAADRHRAIRSQQR